MAQLAPGHQFRFSEVTAPQARAIRAESCAQLARVRRDSPPMAVCAVKQAP
jgi:hypothetical protein